MIACARKEAGIAYDRKRELPMIELPMTSPEVGIAYDLSVCPSPEAEQGPPYDRVRMPRKDRVDGGRDTHPVLRDKSTKGKSKDAKPTQPRGGHRESPP